MCSTEIGVKKCSAFVVMLVFSSKKSRDKRSGGEGRVNVKDGSLKRRRGTGPEGGEGRTRRKISISKKKVLMRGLAELIVLY